MTADEHLSWDATIKENESLRAANAALKEEVGRLREAVIVVLREDIMMNHLTSYSRDELLKAIAMEPGPWTDLREAELRRRAMEG